MAGAPGRPAPVGDPTTGPARARREDAMADLERLARGAARRTRDLGRRAVDRRRRSRERRRARLAATAAPRPAGVEVTHLGPVFERALARKRAAMQPAGVDADYDTAYEHFDLRHFLLQVPGLLEDPDVDPLRQFLGNGARAKASPEINFHLGRYLARHPERAASRRSPWLDWLEEGRAAGEIADPAPGLERMADVLGMAPAAVADELGRMRTDLQRRLLTGTLGRMFAEAAEVEPLVGEAWMETTRPVVPPFYSENTVAQVHALHSCQREAGHRRARVLVVASDPRWGGGRRAEGHIAHALSGRVAPEDVVVVYTDSGGRAPAGRFPDGVREVDLASRVAPIDDEALAMRTLVELVRSFHADVVVNVNSMLLHRAMATYGRGLHASERVFPMMFGNEQLPAGNWVGLPLRYFYRTFDLVAGVLTDSHHLAGWLRERHRLTDEQAARIHVLSAPVDPSIPVADAPAQVPGRRPRVYWAGRFDRQKKVSVVFEVARRMPGTDFHLWGEPVLNRAGAGTPPPNVVLHGAYGHLREIDLGGADAWLYTSGWDGVPGQLLEVAMTGVPLVASLVGGTGEVVGGGEAWPVEDVDDPDAYVAALREVLDDPGKARERARRLRERLVAERTPERYAEQVARALLPHDGSAGSEGDRP